MSKQSSNNIRLDKTYWNTRWQQENTGWDIGLPAPVITEYMLQYANKDAAILIPGCGNAHEAESLLVNGFKNITLIDIAPEIVERLKIKFAGKKEVRIICEDFFKHEGSYDLIIEQTFFCAIPPIKRNEYAQKTASLLSNKGKIIGVLFDKIFEQPGPPFGGSSSIYKELFNPFFIIKKMESCYNSIIPRKGSELFIIMIKK